MIRKYSINDYNDCKKIVLHDCQRDFVSPIDKCLQRENTDKYVIYDEKIIGFAMTRFNKEYNNIFIWQLFIDKNHQRKGYGKEFIEYIITVAQKKNLDVVTTFKVSNKNMEKLLFNLGFKVLYEHPDEIDMIYSSRIP